MGGHVDRCDACGHLRISFNSCRNRNCPKCQGTSRDRWVENRKRDLLPVPYFHVVFTVPDGLNRLCLYRPQLIYNIMFRAVGDTIAQFSYSRLKAETGMFAILHTWGQNLSLHPHIHCVIPGGGLDYRNQWKSVDVSANGKVFLFPVSQLSVVFRAKFVSLLQQALPQDRNFIRLLYRTPWVVYAKEPFGGPQQVIEYLGRYTHKIAISNHRILNVDDNSVTFSWRDYRDNKQKVMTLSGVEFLRRFCQHIVPKRFVRIRHYGLLSCAKRKLLREIQQALPDSPTIGQKQPETKAKNPGAAPKPDICPHCKTGTMIRLAEWCKGRAPPELINSLTICTPA